MVLNFFKLSEQPFGVTPDTRYLYFSPTHREAMASALYGVTSGRGFTAMIAQPGMGKTTLLFDFLQKVRNHAKTVFLFQPQADPRDLLRSLLSDIGIEDEGSDFVRMHRKLNEVLLAESRLGRRLVVVLDEAQNLSDEVLEAVRMLSNFETPREKLMHLVLAGQPHLAEKLASPQLIQLRQRISIIARLEPFTAAETDQYIEHRLRVAGYDFKIPLFTPQAVQTIARYSRGIPRNINNVCFNSMSLGFVAKQRTIDDGMVREVIHDLDLNIEAAEPVTPPQRPEPPSHYTVSAGASGSSTTNQQSLEPKKQRTNYGKSSLPMGRKLGPQLALAAALVVALSWLGIQAKRRTGEVLASPSEAVHAGSTSQKTATAAPAASSSISSNAAQAGGAANPEESMLVEVLPNETLFEICVQAFGKYDDETVALILEMNPWLKDPNQIKAGQQIRVPVSGGTPSGHGTTERLPAALSSEAEKP
jgi:type II secretory pathway predicted ATPase ExeA